MEYDEPTSIDTPTPHLLNAFIIMTEPSLVKRDNKPTGTQIFLPNMLAKWPWPRRINPNYPELRKEVDEWIASFKAFSPKAQDAYDRGDFNLLACLGLPTASKEHARAGCGLNHLLFVIDEYSDRSTPTEVRQQREVVLDAFRNPHTPRPEGEWIGGEITRQFWELTIQDATAVSQRRLVQGMDDYLEAVVQESINKKKAHILDVKSYINARRETSAVKPSFCIVELGLDIPDEVMSHPTVQEMVLAAVDLVALSNDIFSYNLEQQRDDDAHNIITCVMNEYNTDVNGAMLWVEHYLLAAGERFHAARAALPECGELLNSQLKEYSDGLGQWVRALDDWSFESERYFGSKGAEIKERRWMSLLPKKGAKELGPVHIDSSLL